MITKKNNLLNIPPYLYPLVIICALLFFKNSTYATIFDLIREELSVNYSGLLQARYDGRYLSDDEGQDSKLFESADIILSEDGKGHFRICLSGDMMEDLDGTTNKDDSERTSSVHDTWSRCCHGYLYQLYAEIYGYNSLDNLRLGRQYIKQEIPTHIDGLSLSIKPLKKYLSLFAYGGLPVRLYEDVDYLNAKQAGGGSHFQIGKTTQISFEFQYTEEKPNLAGVYNTTVYELSQDGDIISERYKTSYFRQIALTLRKTFFEYCYGFVSVTSLNESLDQAKAMYSMLLEDIDIDIDASYSYQFEKIDNLPASSYEMISLTGPVKPYHMASLDISKGIFQDLTISAGTELRILKSAEDESEFNHSYHHEYFGFSINNIILKKTFFLIHIDVFQSIDKKYQHDSTIFTGGGEIGYNKEEHINISAGSYYSLYKYDYYYEKNEQTDVYTIFLNSRYNLSSLFYVNARYELSIYDIYDHRIQFIVGHRI